MSNNNNSKKFAELEILYFVTTVESCDGNSEPTYSIKTLKTMEETTEYILDQINEYTFHLFERRLPRHKKEVIYTWDLEEYSEDSEEEEEESEEEVDKKIDIIRKKLRELSFEDLCEKSLSIAGEIIDGQLGDALVSVIQGKGYYRSYSDGNVYPK